MFFFSIITSAKEKFGIWPNIKKNKNKKHNEIVKCLKKKIKIVVKGICFVFSQ